MAFACVQIEWIHFAAADSLSSHPSCAWTCRAMLSDTCMSCVRPFPDVLPSMHQIRSTPPRRLFFISNVNWPAASKI
eukprot:8249524-Pyramimonas_sp.AAC.1